MERNPPVPPRSSQTSGHYQRAGQHLPEPWSMVTGTVVSTYQRTQRTERLGTFERTKCCATKPTVRVGKVLHVIDLSAGFLSVGEPVFLIRSPRSQARQGLVQSRR